MFHLGPLDLKYYSNSDGNTLYTSDILTKTWQKGNVLVGLYQYGAGAYITKYIEKSFLEVWSDDDPRLKPYRMMSRNPGIAKEYYEKKFTDLVKDGKVYYKAGDRVRYDKIPRYFRYLFNKEHRDIREEMMEEHDELLSDNEYQFIFDLFSEDAEKKRK